MKKEIDLQELENIDEKFYNHRERRNLIKLIQKNKKIEIIDNLGNKKIINEYKKRLNEEKNNVKKWLERIKKSSNAGNILRKNNEEKAYNYRLHQNEIYDAQYRNLLDEIYGPERAKIEYEKYIKKQEKRKNKLAEKKKK